jgi:hypothetical protein
MVGIILYRQRIGKTLEFISKVLEMCVGFYGEKR